MGGWTQRPGRLAPINPARVSGERCELPQWGLGECISSSQIASGGDFFVIFMQRFPVPAAGEV